MSSRKVKGKTVPCLAECPHVGWPHEHLVGGLTVIQDWPRRYRQECPRCFTTVETDDLQIAQLILAHGCLDCRFMECDREHAIKQASPTTREGSPTTRKELVTSSVVVG